MALRLRAAKGREGEGGMRETGGASMEYGEGHDKNKDEPTLFTPRRLHLASPISFDLFLHRMRLLAPHLTPIRLSKFLAFKPDMVRTIHSELAEHGAIPVDWERLLSPRAQLRRIVVQRSPFAAPASAEQLCGCYLGYYRVDDITRSKHEIVRDSYGRHRSGSGRGAARGCEEGNEDPGDGSAFVFLPPGSKHDAYSFEEGYRDDWDALWASIAAGRTGPSRH